MADEPSSAPALEMPRLLSVAVRTGSGIKVYKLGDRLTKDFEHKLDLIVRTKSLYGDDTYTLFYRDKQDAKSDSWPAQRKREATKVFMQEIFLEGEIALEATSVIPDPDGSKFEATEAAYKSGALLAPYFEGDEDEAESDETDEADEGDDETDDEGDDAEGDGDDAEGDDAEGDDAEGDDAEGDGDEEGSEAAESAAS